MVIKVLTFMNAIYFGNHKQSLAEIGYYVFLARAFAPITYPGYNIRYRQTFFLFKLENTILKNTWVSF
jgi:hypothetical protein